ncbi:MAG: prepilin peptidase [Acidobacteriaceae bacterium]
MIALLLFIFGLIVGSFLNVVIFRLHSGKSFVKGRSACPHCGHELSALDLVPVLSFILLKARCRYCRNRISWQYPLVEIITGLSFALIGFSSDQFTLLVFTKLIFASVMIVVAVYDLKHFLILDKVLVPAIVAALVLNAILDANSACSLLSINCHSLGGLAAAALACFFFLAQYMLSGGKWIGFGDVKFGILLGLIAGWPGILALLFLAYVIGAATGLGLMAAGKKTMTSKLPFGTFLGLAAILTMAFGSGLVAWYLNLIGIQ